MSDPQNVVLDMIFGRWRSQTLYAGVKLGVFDAIDADPGASTTPATTVAARLGLDPALCYRLLRALASLGLLHEDGQRGFSLTEAGDVLREDHPQTMRGVTLLEEGPEHYALWKHLPAMVRDGRRNAFVREFGHMAFDHAARDPGYGTVFNNAMSSYSGAQTAWVLEALSAYDFTQIHHLCDIGGGHGHMLCTLLSENPHLRGSVCDLPTVVAQTSQLWADRLGVTDRCTYVAGDMFAAVPRADAYMMKMILHDWNDDEGARVLCNIKKAALPGARLFIVEHIISDPATPHFAKLFDIHMMCWGTGQERTVDEYASLLQAGGWRHVHTWYPQSGMMGVIEAAIA